MNLSAWSKKLLLAALLLVLNVLVFGTFTIYSNNLGEFQVSYLEVLSVLLLPMLASVGVLLLVGTILPKKARYGYLLLLLLLGIVGYFHANILVWDMGVLDGNQLDFTKPWRGWIDAAIWLGALTFALRFRRGLLDHCGAICAGLIALQLVTGLVSAAYRPQVLEGDTDFQDFPPLLGEFSSQGNVVHLILDAFQANLFQELLNDNPQYSELFAGFTFFPDTVTSSDITYLSVPALLSGKDFQNTQTISEYWRQTLDGDNVFRVLATNGYGVDVATPMWWNHRQDYQDAHYRIPTPYAKKEQVGQYNTLLLVDIALFRYAPWFLKSIIYDRQSWLLSGTKFPKKLSFDHFSHTAFLRDFAGRMALTDRAPVYKSLHLVTPHAPIVTNARCEPSEGVLDYNEHNFKQQSACVLESVRFFLDRLKELDIYDSSLILIHGDHGTSFEFGMRSLDGSSIGSLASPIHLSGAPLPLLLIKPPGSTGKLSVSDTSVQLSDIPTTISELLELEHTFAGESAFRSDPKIPRERRYYRGEPHRNDALANDYFDSYQSYVVHGSAYLASSWSRGPVHHAQRLRGLLVSEWKTPFTFGADGSSKPAQQDGWSRADSGGITWNSGSTAALRFRFPISNRNIKMTASVKAFLVPGGLDRQRVLVSINSNQVAEWVIRDSEFQLKELVLPMELLDSAEPIEVRFSYPDAESPLVLGVGGDARELGLAFRSIEFVQE